MAYEKQTWISYDDNKTEEQNIKDGAVVTAERMNHIEDGVEAQATKIEFDSHLDDKGNPHEVTAHQVGALTAEETSANVIYQVIGKEKAEITFRLDAKSEFVKVSSVGYTTLLSPTNVSWTPLTEEQLNNLSSLDGSLYSARDAAANYMKQLKYDCDILGFFKSLLGEKFFTIRGATTDSQKVEVLESLITDFTSNVYGYGSGGGINKLTHRNWNGTWTVSDSTAANEVTRIGQTIESTDTNWKKLINGGKISVLSNSEPTISPNYSTVNIDYLCLDVTIELSANEHFEYMIAAYSGENIDKKFVGLENVDNYGTATQAEAESGTATDKFMTPLRTKQHVSSRIATQTEAEGGTASEKLMTPLCTKQHVDKRIATQEEVDEGEATGKIVSPKTLADLLRLKMPLKMYWGPGSTLNDSGLNARLTFGDLIGIDPFHKSTDIPFTINSGKYEATMTRDADLFFDINLRLQGGGASTAYSDYYYIQLEYGSQTGGSGESKKDFAMIGANNGQRLNLSNTLTGKAIVSLKKGQKFAITATGLRSGQKIFAWQFLSGTIEEYILT